MKQAGHILTVVIALGSLTAIAGACGEGSSGAACLPGDVERCTCADGKTGYMVCDLSAGAFYGSCNCALDGSPYLPEAGVEAGPEEGGEGGGGMTLNCSGPVLDFMCPCSMAAGAPQCKPTDMCYPYPSKGSHCSHPCKSPMDCPYPSPGCTPMNECKAP